MRTLVFLLAFLAFACHARELTDNLRRSGFTELHAAAWNGDVEAIRTLVKRGVDVGVSSDSGITPLHSAAIGNQAGSIDALVALGAPLEARDNTGRTPLFIAVDVNAHPAAVLNALLAAGASPVAKDKFGKTPLEAAWTDEARALLAPFSTPAGPR